MTTGSGEDRTVTESAPVCDFIDYGNRPGGGSDGGGGTLGGGGGGNGFSRNPGDRTDVTDASQGDDPCSSGSNPKSGNPIVLGTGNKVETEVDFTSAGEMPLTLERTYDHYWSYIGIFGKYWVSNLDYSITIAADESTILAQRPDGRRIKFFRDPLDANRWNEDKGTGSDHIFCDGFDASGRNLCYENGTASIAYITRSGSTYTHWTEDNDTELYDAEGRITRRTNSHGISWTFGYTNRLLTSVTRSSGRVSGVGRTMSLVWTNNKISVVSPDGSTFEYQFVPDAADPNAKLLVQSRIPGMVGNPAVTIDYHYEDARFPGALTGKSFNGKRYSTFAYDAYARATDSKHAGSTPGTFVDAYHFDYTGVPTSPPLGGPADPPPPGVPCNPGPPNQCPANPIAPDSGTPAATTTEDALIRRIPAAASTVTETNPLGHQTTYTFLNGRVTATSSPASAHCGARASARTYDAFGYDDHVTDFNGNVTDYDYAANGQLAQQVEASGSAVARTTSYTWDTLRNRPLTETVKGLEQTTYGYSPQNRIASITLKNLAPYGTPNQTRAWTYQYTTWNGASGELKQVVADGPLPGDTVTSSYSEDGDLLSVVSPTGTTTYSGYDDWGRPSHVVGENGETVDYTYYPGGKLKSVTTYPNGATPAKTSYAYADGMLSTVTTPDGITTSFTYDNARRLVTTSRPVIGGTAARTLTYDANSNVTRIDETLSGVLTYRSTLDYDELGRVRARHGNNLQNDQYTYDANGNLKTATDSYAKTTTYGYDALNRLSTSTDPLQGVATFTYDAADRLKSVKDPHNVTTTYQRDGFGQLWKEISADRGTTTYAYLGDGLLDTMTRGNGVQTSYQFDGMGRLAKRTAAGQSETFAYDLCTNGIGRLCSATSPGTTLSYAYEPDGRVRSRKDQITLAGVQSIYMTSYAYDTVGRLSKLTYPNGEAATYAYSIGQPTSMTMTVGGVAKNMVTSASFEPSGRLSGYTHGNGLVRDYVFDLDGRTSAITSKNGAAAVQSLSYLYDKEDRITTITNPLPNYGESYGYDALSRLTSATGAGYTYDANGNRLTALPNGSVFTYVPGSNRIATVSDIFIAPDGSIVTGDPPVPDYVSSFTHDGAGNIKKWDFPATLTASYTYDGFNRMNAVLDTTSGSVTLGQYGYNAFGERTSKRDLTHAHDYAFIYGEGHELLADRENGAWTNYVWFAGELVGMTRAGVLYQIDNDHLGRPETITNANKAVVWQSNNDPFGGMHPTTNTLGEFNIGLPGQYFDAESNYWYNVNRYYVPAIGRYLQADPVGLGGGLNPYAYVGGNPANSTDPTGLGPVAFGLCTAANFAYQGYSIYSSLRADGVSEIQDRLQSVNKEIDDCPGTPPLS